MKKIISIFLIISIISPLWLFHSIVQYEKYTTKKEIKKFLISNINKSELVLLKFSIEETKTKLRWEHSKEFEYNNEMYDVVEKEVISDSVFYWCWWDKEETKLNRKLESLVKLATENHPKNRDRSERLTNFLNSFFAGFSFNQNFYDNGTKHDLFSRYLLNYISLNITPDTPPPKA